MRRRRPRRGSRLENGRNAKLVWIGCCVLSLLLVLLIIPSTAYNVSESGRQSAADVVADDTALVGLVKASSIEEGQQSWMVTTGNNFSQVAVEVTLELTPPSRSEGNLVVDGIDVGNSTTHTLQPGDQKDISACFTDNGDGIPDHATFNATFSGTTTVVSGSIDQRNVSIVDTESETLDC